tara:strand:+ start:7085 stop:7816 length:732 start_codon:yes stop_codon:yes gene_type:complete
VIRTGTNPEGPRLVLIHSPLTGPSFWRGVHDALWRRGRRALLARLPAAQHIHAPYWLTHASGVAAGLPEEGEVVLVAHSGAGPLLPAIGRLARNRTAGARVAGYLFVDSDLPRDGASRLELFDDPAQAEALRQRSRGGWLPTWTAADVRALVPDPESFVAELPRTPLALYDESIRVPDDWPDAPCGYLSLSAQHYRGAVRAAEAAGWPCHALNAHHFAPLADPEGIAAAIDAVVGDLAAPDPA